MILSWSHWSLHAAWMQFSLAHCVAILLLFHCRSQFGTSLCFLKNAISFFAEIDQEFLYREEIKEPDRIVKTTFHNKSWQSTDNSIIRHWLCKKRYIVGLARLGENGDTFTKKTVITQNIWVRVIKILTGSVCLWSEVKQTGLGFITVCFSMVYETSCQTRHWLNSSRIEFILGIKHSWN